MSLLKDFLPGQACRDFVKCFRIVHFEFEKNDQIPFKVYPPKPEIILHFFIRDKWEIEFEGQRKVLSFVTLVGQQTYISRQFSGKTLLDFQIVFLPSALYRIFGIPA